MWSGICNRSGRNSSRKIGCLIQAIQPAVDTVKSQTGDPVDNAAIEKIKRSVKKLKAAAPILSERVNAGQLQIAGAFYDLDTGEVILIKN